MSWRDAAVASTITHGAALLAFVIVIANGERGKADSYWQEEPPSLSTSSFRSDASPEGYSGRQEVKSVWDGVYSAEQAERGSQVYLRSCSSCHARNLRGGEGAPALVGSAFLDAWYGKSLGALLELVRSTMPAVNPAGLGDAEYAVLVAHILHENSFPPGEHELSTDPNELIEILIEKEK